MKINNYEPKELKNTIKKLKQTIKYLKKKEPFFKKIKRLLFRDKS